MAAFPPDPDTVIEKAWQLTQRTAGFLGENEARFLGMLAACVPARGAIIEIGSFKGKSTVMLASVAAHYGLGPVVAIDPHTSPSTTDPGIAASSSTFEEFLAAVKAAGLTASKLTAPFRATWRKDGTDRFACCGSTGIIHFAEQKKTSICLHPTS